MIRSAQLPVTEDVAGDDREHRQAQQFASWTVVAVVAVVTAAVEAGAQDHGGLRPFGAASVRAHRSRTVTGPTRGPVTVPERCLRRPCTTATGGLGR